MAVPNEPVVVEYRRFHAGAESAGVGWLWSAAPPVRGQRSVWVLDDERRPHRVVYATRRQRLKVRDVYAGEAYCNE